ncbi:sulfurtransferase [Aquimarina sp. 2201CG5-10]|uniref:sulfurtransferase n=1 Tax=Aquimarina callyspongiae TaxID=3098150 RepID=UPI002AB3D2C6|nr:sulfurtransferase [Aquimarina sp. 2201CG5-10]MDY8138738.1 sulfurtransferase [Aquimarina sp. 2201CG5-10]
MNTLQLPTPLVSIDWLSQHQDHPDLIILDATIKKVTSNKDSKDQNLQIKGARFFDIKRVFSDKNTDIPNMLPSPEVFEQACQDLGINRHHKIVIYDTLGIYSSPRVWWMFKTMGYHDVSVLDGGLPAWRKANLPEVSIQDDQKTYEKGNFKAIYQPHLVSNAEKVQSKINSEDTMIIDARSNGRFVAIEPEPRANLKGGHIPGSKNLHYIKVLEENKMLPKEKLNKVFKNFNIENKNLIFTCGSGITACIIMMAAEISGYQKTSIYDGSWSEWGQLENVPVKS